VIIELHQLNDYMNSIGDGWVCEHSWFFRKPSSMKKEWTSCDHRWSLGEPSSDEKEMYG
jgi:hypothetical protein